MVTVFYQCQQLSDILHPLNELGQHLDLILVYRHDLGFPAGMQTDQVVSISSSKTLLQSAQTFFATPPEGFGTLFTSLCSHSIVVPSPA